MKVSLESVSRDHQQVVWTHFYLTDPDTLFTRAIERLKEGPALDLDGGQNILKGLLRTNAASGDRWVDAEGAFVQAGQIDKAEYCLDRAAQLAPNSAGTLLSIAIFYLNTTKPRNALPYFGKVLGGATDYDATVFNHFDTLHLSGRESFGSVVVSIGSAGAGLR